MAEIVPKSWDWQREYEEIRQELTRRWQYETSPEKRYTYTSSAWWNR